MKRPALIALAVVAGVIVIGGFSCVSSYNKLVSLDEGVKSSWAQVQNAYQRRADLIPNLVETVKGAANFERDTLIAVTEARTRAVAAPAGPGVTGDPQKFKEFQGAQDQLGGALGRLMVVVEKYPELKATANFRDLQAQIEGTENRIATERMRYNEAARVFNTKRNSFPTTILAGFFGSRFSERVYFEAQAGSDKPPAVKF